MKYLLHQSLIATVALSLFAPASYPQSPEVKKVVLEYQTNIERFQQYTCKFTLNEGDGFPKLESNPLQFEWTKKFSAECRLAVDGDFEAYEQYGDGKPEPLKSDSKKSASGFVFAKVIGIQPIKYIRNQKQSGNWCEPLSQLSMVNRTRNIEDTGILSPLDLGFEHRRCFGPNRSIKYPDRYSFEHLGNREIQGADCIGIRSVSPLDDNLIREYWFDPAIGMLPRLHDTHQNGKHVSRFIVLSAKLAANGAWYPERVIKYSPPVKSGFAREMIVKELVLARPTEKELSIQLPAGTSVQNQETGDAFRLRKDESISGKDLPELFEKADLANRKPLQQTAIEHKAAKINYWFWGFGGVGLVFISYGVFRWFRTRARRNATGL